MDQFKEVGFALKCHHDGQVVEVLRDDLGLAAFQPVGKLFPSLVDQNSRQVALGFLLEAKQRGIAYNFLIDLRIDGVLVRLSFMGINTGNQILVVASGQENSTLEFLDHLQTINNEQVNIIRRLIKSETVLKTNEQETTRLFNEVTRQNNELVNLQRELSKKNFELSKMNDLKNQYLGMVAHDLRNPINVISSFSEFLLEETVGILSEEHSKFLKIISESTHFMIRLIEDLLDISKIESGKLQLFKVEADIVEQIRKNVKLNQSIAGKKSITLVFNFKGTIFIEFDPHKIEQVLNNLISNAIKFSNPGSDIHINLDEEPEKVVIRVKDSGKGISESDLSALFVPFKQVSASGTGGEKGTGLGLAIVQKIIEGHGGKIWVNSKINEGSEFFFSLPKNSTVQP